MRSRFDMNFPSTLRHKTGHCPVAGPRSSAEAATVAVAVGRGHNSFDSHNTTTVDWGDPMESSWSALGAEGAAERRPFAAEHVRWWTR